jgi:ribosomal protein S18 acetylase RimI-like enzyme
MVGVAALKRPLDSYRAKVAGRAGVKLKPSEWPFELGYVFVSDDQRGVGLGRSLTDALIREAGSANIFATVRANNERMRTVLRRFEFAVAGRDYLSDDGERILSLWIRHRPT